MFGSVITFIIALLTLSLVIVLLRRGHLREKYAILWLFLSLVTMVLSGFPQILLWASQILGVQVPSNLIFAVALLLLVGITLHLGWELSTVEDEARALAEEIGIIHVMIADMQNAHNAESSTPQRQPSSTTQT
ncbi:MAG: DUF2304 domain-containing protein [Arthrobacter sp.]|nr:DUF2304 domain-containing protein [Arthrobacter sp.]